MRKEASWKGACYGLARSGRTEAVLPAETSAFPSPIPAQSVSSDEFMPAPQTAKQREFEARMKAVSVRSWRTQQGMSRRAFFKTASGMAAAFVAMNDTYGPLFA